MRPLAATVACASVAAGLALTLSGAHAATPPEEALARQVQGLRRASAAADPAAVEAIPYPTWNADQAGCRGWDDIAWALVFDNDCLRYSQGAMQGEAVDTVMKFYQAGKSLHSLSTDPGATAHDVLEGLAAGFDAGQNTVKCITKSWVRATVPEGPERNRQLLLIDAAADAVSLSEAVLSIRNLATKGPSGLGGTRGAQATEGTKLTSSGTQVGGWFENLFKAVSDLHASRLAATEGRLLRARQRLGQCVTTEVEAIFPEAEADALGFVAETRAWAVDIEKQVYCEALAHGGGLAPAQRSKIDSVNLLERSAVHNYSSVVAERDRTEQALQARKAELDDLLERLSDALAAADRALEGCDESAADEAARQLGRLQGETCLQQAEASLGAGETVREVRDELERSVAAWRDFFRMMNDAESDAEALLSACRFDEVSESFRRAFDAFDRRWQRFTVVSLRGCWAEPRESDEWPPDRLGARAQERAAEVRGKVAAAGEAMGRSVEARLACRWQEARTALDEARRLLEEAGCPASAPALLDYAASFERLERLTALLDEREAVVLPKQEALEAARRDLLQSLEEKLYEAEDPAHPERCAAIERVSEMVGLAAGFTPPAECPESAAPGFDAAIESARQRAEAARTLGQAELTEAVQRGDEAAKRCELAELEAALADLTALPTICGADPATSIAALASERQRLLAEIDGFRARIGAYEQEWDGAWQSCDTAELQAVANAIVAWSANACARANLNDAEKARVAALEAYTPERAAAVARRAAEVQRVLGAKLVVGRGYVNTLESIVGDPHHAVTHAQRIADDARQFVAFVRNYANPTDLPVACYQATLDEIRSLPPIIERLVGQLAESEAAADASDSEGHADATVISSAWTTSGSTSEVRQATSNAAAQEATVSVPDLRGQKEGVAIAWLEDLELRAVVRKGGAAANAGEQGTVEAMAPSPGTAVEPDTAVSIWIRGEAETTPPALSQADCDRDWPGTVLAAEGADGAPACRCPEGRGWSKVQNRCLELPGAGADRDVDAGCAQMPGTLRDPATGACRCPVGAWDAGQGRCVDRAAEAKEKEIGELQRGASCERLYADLEIFSSHPEPLYRQLSAAARQRASEMGCDPARIAAAMAASRRFGTPSGGTTGGGSGTSTSSGAATPSGDGQLCVLMDIDYGHVGSGPIAYLVYRAPSTSPGRVPDAYGVLAVPTRIESQGRTSCTGARACFARIAPSAPFRILGEYSSRAAAAAEARRHCPHPANSSSY